MPSERRFLRAFLRGWTLGMRVLFADLGGVCSGKSHHLTDTVRSRGGFLRSSSPLTVRSLSAKKNLGR
ncbi:hypothetical protein Pla52n_20610 [Stieleria varia]|uniref:Uncharacterized protein n=1 Tax=Stieleria varia TaxID=2528005 RepID=A0A5C6B369_9BACT|nr:hypothetical protein Pla52n_20610 [Stieleria varia]